MSDPARQELKAWIKRQREALPERREGWAHGAAETLCDLEREIDRIFGPENTSPDKCAICGDKATVRDGMVGMLLCTSPSCFGAAWDRAFPDES